MIVILLLVLTLYITLITWLWWGTQQLPSTSLDSAPPKTAFSIIIPFRNEARHLPQLLDDLLDQTYPQTLVELFFVDDASTDASSEIIQTWITTKANVQCHLLDAIRCSASPKKDAIKTAIDKASHPWILTIDADIRLKADWLKAFASCIENEDPDLVAAPVSVQGITSFNLLTAYELFDIHSLMAATMGSFGIHRPIMANGANLAYKKTAFLALEGFNGNDHMASGDDIFLLQKFIKNPAYTIRFLHSTHAIALTYPNDSWSSLLEQRKRWASKATGYTDAFAKAVGLIVILGNLVFTVGLLLLILHLFLPSDLWIWVLAIVLLLKVIVDWILIDQAFRFAQIKNPGWWYLPVMLLHPLLTLALTALAFTTPYNWKGRQFDQ